MPTWHDNQNAQVASSLRGSGQDCGHSAGAPIGRARHLAADRCSRTAPRVPRRMAPTRG